MTGLKLVALDAEDLAVLSAHLHGTTLTAADIAWLPGERRLVLAARRGGAASDRVLGLRFDRVMRAERLRLPLDQPGTPLTFIGALFQPGNPPGGHVLLLFEDGRSLRLTVECIEAVLAELAAPAAEGA